MSEFNKYSTDGGATFIDVEDTNGRIMSEQLIRDTVGWTGKNKLPYPYAEKTKTEAGITFTDNGDGSVTIGAGTVSSSSSAFFAFANSVKNTFTLKKGTYILTGGISDNIVVQFQTSNSDVIDTGNGATFTLDSDYTFTTGRATYIRVVKGTVLSEAVTVKPMIRLATISDSTYEPYHDNVSTEITDVYKVMGEMGAKNLLPFPYSDMPNNVNYGGVYHTVNSDGSITCQGTGGNGGCNFILPTLFPTLKKGKYILSAGITMPTGCNLSATIGGVNYNVTDGLDEIVIDLSEDSVVTNFRTWFANGTSVDLTIYPMLRLAADKDDTYALYAMTNRELTKKLTPDSFTYTYTGTNGKTATFEFHKYGDIVIIKSSGSDQVDFKTSWEDFSDAIPTEFRPKHNFNTSIVLTSAHCINIRAFTNGTLSFMADTTSPLWVQGSAVYYLD